MQQGEAHDGEHDAGKGFEGVLADEGDKEDAEEGGKERMAAVAVEDDGSDNAVRKYNRIEKITDIDVLEFDGEGKIKNEGELLNGIKEEWSDFIVTTSSKGAETATPPSGNGSTYKP